MELVNCVAGGDTIQNVVSWTGNKKSIKRLFG